MCFMCHLLNAGCCGGGKCCPGSNCCPKPAQKATPQPQPAKNVIKETVKQAYAQVAQEKSSCSCVGGGCCGGGADFSKFLGYTEEELDNLKDANLGLGCGNPIALGEFKKGATVLDLGSGPGMDCLLAAKKVGTSGNAIGVDMTPEMIELARANADKYGITNVEFRLGDIENLPVANNSVDIVISNCVINLAPDKLKVFKEAYRVLKPNGTMYVSDVVLLKELSSAQKNDAKLLCACVSGALLKNVYISLMQKAGFTVEIVKEDATIGKLWFNDDQLPIESLDFRAYKK